MHGCRKCKSMHVKQGDSTSHFNIKLLIAVLILVAKPRPRRKFADAGIQLEQFVAGRNAALVNFASETPHAFVWTAGGTLSITELTWCHVVVGQLFDPRADRLS